VKPLELVRSVPPRPTELREPGTPVVDERARPRTTDCVACVEFVRASVDTVVDALAPDARAVVRDVFGKRVRLATWNGVFGKGTFAPNWIQIIWDVVNRNWSIEYGAIATPWDSSDRTGAAEAPGFGVDPHATRLALATAVRRAALRSPMTPARRPTLDRRCAGLAKWPFVKVAR
jgi:hypothetical protein